MEFFNKEEFEQNKNQYLTHLQNRTELMKDLSKINQNSRLIQILLNPQDNAELDFGIAFLSFIDDNRQIEENINQGNIKEINTEESIGIDCAAKIIKVLYDEEEIQDELDFFSKPTVFAKVLYELSVLSTIDHNQLIETIMIKNGNDPDDIDQCLLVSGIYKSLLETMVEFLCPNTEDSNTFINRFITITEAFHDEYWNGRKYDEPLSTATIETKTPNPSLIKTQNHN